MKEKWVLEHPGTLKNPKELTDTVIRFYDSSQKRMGNEHDEDNSATPMNLSWIRAWMELSKYGEYEKCQNMINVPLARQKSTLEHRSNNVPSTVENVAHAQPSVSHEEDKIQISNFEHVPIKRPREDPEEDDRKPAAKRIKKEPEDDA